MLLSLVLGSAHSNNHTLISGGFLHIIPGPYFQRPNFLLIFSFSFLFPVSVRKRPDSKTWVTVWKVSMTEPYPWRLSRRDPLAVVGKVGGLCIQEDGPSGRLRALIRWFSGQG